MKRERRLVRTSSTIRCLQFLAHGKGRACNMHSDNTDNFFFKKHTRDETVAAF